MRLKAAMLSYSLDKSDMNIDEDGNKKIDFKLTSLNCMVVSKFIKNNSISRKIN